MKICTIIAAVCLATFGFTQVADAKPHRARHHAAKKTVSRGVSTSTTDVNGDGTADVVTTPKPKRRTSGSTKPPSGGGISVGQ